MIRHKTSLKTVSGLSTRGSNMRNDVVFYDCVSLENLFLVMSGVDNICNPDSAHQENKTFYRQCVNLFGGQKIEEAKH